MKRPDRTAASSLVHGAYRVKAEVARSYSTRAIVGVRVVVIAALLAACGGDDARTSARQEVTGGDRPTSAPGSAGGRGAVAAGPPSNAKPICPATGVWQICSVMERLDRAGLAPRRDSAAVREAPLSSTGVAIHLGRSELRVFIYPDRTMRERDQARLDRRRYVAPSEPVGMGAEPTLIVSENLLAILRSRSDHQRERVADALTAGPPQSPRGGG